MILIIQKLTICLILTFYYLYLMTKLIKNTVTLHCNQEGVIKKFNAHSGEFTFKQENKGTFS